MAVTEVKKYCKIDFGLTICTLLLCLISPVQSHENKLPSSVTQALSQAQIPLSHIAVAVQPIVQPIAPPKGAALAPTPYSLAINPDLAMNPASVMKLITTYTALNVLGPQWRWRTRILAEPQTAQRPMDGVVEGPVYLQGGGDPKFALEHLTALLRQLRVSGIHTLQGGMVLDRQAFRLPEFDAGRFDDLPMRPYNVGPDALLINFHALNLSLVPQGNFININLETPVDGLVIRNQLQLGKGHCDDWKDSITPQIKGRAGEWELLLQGAFNPSCGRKTLNIAPLPNHDYAEILIRAIWKELGGKFEGPIRPGTTPSQAVLLAEQESPPLVDIIKDINKFSNNVMARQTFLSLAETAPATLEDARTRTLAWLQQNGLRSPDIVIDNGSGLSRHERISTSSLAKILQHAWRNPLMPEFVASLPIVGMDGTMRKRLNGRGHAGYAHIKTGTLAGVKSIAGYVQNQRGERFVVVFIINHPKAQQGQAAMDALLQWLISGR